MNPNNKTIEYNSLSWVKTQLDDVLSDAQTNLNDYIETKADENLENCLEHLQLIQGTLQMVEVYGASMLAEEMQHTIKALLDEGVESEHDAYDVLMRSMLQLPDYLEGIQAGKIDAPMALMPLINDLRVVRNENLLTQGVLFSPDIENTELDSSDYNSASIESGKLQEEVKRLRTHYQLGLLDYIRNDKQREGLQRIKAVLNSLEKVSSNSEVRHMWMIAGALTDGLLDEGIEDNLSVQKLLGSVDRQFKLVLDLGEAEFVNQYSKDLVTNILYYVGLSTVDSDSVVAIKNAYKLAELLPNEGSDGDCVAVAGLNADLFDTVSKGITEDLGHVKDILELFMHSSEKDTEQLVPVAEQLAKLGDTYGMLGLGITRQSIMEQCDVLKSIINGDIDADEKVVLDIATALLSAESELRNYIDERAGFIDMNCSSDEQNVPAAEYRQVVFSVVTEGLKNFSEAKEAILLYITGEGDSENLEVILNRLEEVRGVAMMLPLGRVESQIEKLQSYIRIALLNNQHQPAEDEQDTVADVVTSIEYFFEALSEGRPGVEQGLDAGDAAAAKLEAITHSYDAPDVVTEIEQDSITEGDANESIQPKPEALESVEEYQEIQSETEHATELAATESAKVEQYAILSDDADEEIVEIFIEEAIEVLGELHENLPLWKSNPGDEEALSTLRRGFHTLKGSGRLMGAEMIGEFSWRFENMLNRLVENKINNSESFSLALDEALAVLPQLIEQLKGNREPIANITQLMSMADAIAEGHDVSFELTVSTISEVVDETVDAGNSEELSIDTDEIETLEAVSSEISESLSISDGLDLDNDELNDSDVDAVDLGTSGYDASDWVPEDNISPDSVDDNSIEDSNVSVNSESNAVTDSAEGVVEIDAGEITDGFDEELVSLESSDILGEDLSSESDALIVSQNDIDTLDAAAPLAVEEDEIEETEVEQAEVGTETIDDSESTLGLDPVLLQIYHDESLAHIETIREQLAKAELDELPVKVNKDLIRAFHTLYGSARTAEVQAIADLTGAAEKYILAREDSGVNEIPEQDAQVLREIEQSVTLMLEILAEGELPHGDNDLHAKIDELLQQEIQRQLQKPWQGDAEDTVEDLSVDELGAAESETDVAEEESMLENMSAEETEDQISIARVEIVYGDVDDELIDIYLEEADELLESCEQIIGEIKDEPNSTEHINKLQRNMHTLKGGARMADLAPIGDLTHNLESLVVMVEDKKLSIDTPILDLLQESLDVLTSMVTAVRKRESYIPVGDLNERIETMMRGDIKSKGAIEDFDVDMAVLESSNESPEPDDSVSSSSEGRVEETREDTNSEENKQERRHWGERATDVNYKDSQEQVRVRADLLNNLVDYAGEVNIYHARMGKQVSDFSYNLSELTQTVDRLKEQLRKLEIETEIQIRSGYEKEADSFDANFDPLEMDQYSTLQQLTRSLSETASDVDSIHEILSDITRDTETLLVQESRISTDLQEGLMRTRMVRFGGLSSRLRRIVRQVARELGKDVEVTINGESSEVDRTILDRFIAPLEHMLRNAVAHGIEMPSVRRAKGKNESGLITINVDRQGADVVIDVSDDGAGMDADKIREKAVKQGLMPVDSEVSDRDALQFILHAGFSTADKVTQISGRGVGMDVVDSEIKQLGGVLEIDTVPGKGSDFRVRLPLTLAINQALLVNAADDVFAVPLSSIEGVVRVTGVELQGFYDSENSHYEFNGVEYELKHLGGLLTGHQANYAKQLQLFPVLLVKVGDQHFALHVESLIGRREIVVKPVGMQIGSVHGIAGATILADGRVVLILEMSALVVADSLFGTQVIANDAAPVEVDDDVKTIMVVDDSITIRKITERMLKRYGVNVVLAKDGVDATNLLQDHIPDMMLLDIEMPRMDGFEVASYVRNDERLKDIPIIMITSRTGSKHKDKAMEIGVNQYLGKPFKEEDLISNINDILNTSF